MGESSAAQWAEVERLFAQAYDLPPEDRAGFLARECPDEDLRQEVLALLEHSGKDLGTAGFAIAAEAAKLMQESSPDERLIGTRLGPYKVEAIAGHGGMGTVYRASRDDAEFRQQVAIKLVRAAAATPTTLRRFRQERQILAQLAHPNIARLLDGGSTPDGVPYLVMEFIEGQPITAWCESCAPGLQERLHMFLRVCEGVEFAHRSLIVHRDLKPGNILVTRDGTPKLLDFGIAKLLDPALGNQPATLTGLPVMTPEYAAPEQVRNEVVSPATDVYALGLILYEMLTGRKAQPIAGLSPSAITRVVSQSEPAAPAVINPQLAGDLDNIIRMAIRKEPERRYASAGDLACDIQRYLDGRPVAARADRLTYRAGKFLQRQRARVAAATAIAASLCLGLLLAYWLGQPNRQPRVLRVVQLTQTGHVEGADGIATDGQQVFFTERIGGRWSMAKIPVDGGTPQPVPLPERLFQPDILDISPDRSQLLVDAEGRGPDRPLWLVPTKGGAPIRLGDAWGRAGAWSPDGRRIVFAKGFSLFQMRSDGAECHKLKEKAGEIAFIRWGPAPKDLLRFSLVGRPHITLTLCEASSSGNGVHRILDSSKFPQKPGDMDNHGVWLPDGRYYLFQSKRGNTTGVWAMREPRHILPGFGRMPLQIYSTPLELNGLAIHPDGKRIFFTAGQERRELLRYDEKRHQFLPFLPGIAGRWVDFSKDGEWVVYTTFLDDAMWRSRADGSNAARLTPTSMRVHQPRWSPDGTAIAFTVGDKIYVIPSAGGAPQQILGGSNGEPCWSSDGKRILFQKNVSSNAPGTAGLYVTDLAARKTEFVPGSEEFSRPAWSPNSRYIAANRAGAEIQLFDFQTRKWTLMATGRGLAVPFWSRDSEYIYYQDAFGGVEQPIFRVNIHSRKIERMMTAQQIPQSNLTGYGLAGMAPDDMPIATVVRSNTDIYALEVDLP